MNALSVSMLLRSHDVACCPKYLARFTTTRTTHYYLVQQAKRHGKTRTRVVAFTPHAGDVLNVGSRAPLALRATESGVNCMTSRLASDLVQELSKDEAWVTA